MTIDTESEEMAFKQAYEFLEKYSNTGFSLSKASVCDLYSLYDIFNDELLDDLLTAVLKHLYRLYSGFGISK